MKKDDIHKRLILFPVGTTLIAESKDKAPFSGGRVFKELYEIDVDHNGEKILTRLEKWWESNDPFVKSHKRMVVPDGRSQKIKGNHALKRFFGEPDTVYVFHPDTCELVGVIENDDEGS